MLFNFLYAVEDPSSYMDRAVFCAKAVRALTRVGLLERQKDRSQKKINEILIDDALFGASAKALQTILQKDKSLQLRDRVLLMNQSCCNISAVAQRKAIPLSVEKWLKQKGISLEKKEFLAAGSMAQIGIGRYHNRIVAMKIVNPHLKKTDLTQKLLEAAHIPTKHRSGICNTEAVVQRLLVAQKEEMDLSRELQCMERCSELLSERYRQEICIPEVFKDISDKDLLIMEFIEGESLEDICLKDYSDSIRQTVAKKAITVLFQCFIKRTVVNRS